MTVERWVKLEGGRLEDLEGVVCGIWFSGKQVEWIRVVLQKGQGLNGARWRWYKVGHDLS